MAKKKGGEQDCPKFPAWMTTFSDLMSLLLTFFILLYSMSVIDITSFFKLVSFFQGGRTITPPATVIPPPVSPPQISRLAIKAQKILSKIHAYSAFQVIVSRNEITIRFPYGVNFDKGDYKLKPKFKRALQGIILLLCSFNFLGEIMIQVKDQRECIALGLFLFFGNWTEINAVSAKVNIEKAYSNQIT